MSYSPPPKVIEKYADLLINFALGGGKGIKQGEVVMLYVPDIAKPFLRAMRNTVLKAGGHPLARLYPTDMGRDFYELANDDQLTFFPEKFEKARADLIDHTVSIIADTDPHELKGLDPTKIFKARDSRKKVREWFNAKENKGQFTWTLALWGTPAMAKEAGLSEQEYWKQIIQGCYLDKANPIQEWQDIAKEQLRVRKKLDSLSIEKVHIEGENIDLWIQIGEERAWNGGSGRNIPSFEIFTSPNWRGTNGHIAFNQPLYRYGNLIEGIRLEFKDGLVVKATAKKGQKVLRSMLESQNANKLGEFSLTDSRVSRITKFMANTLFDENIGGRYGNTHVAIGKAYQDCYKGDPAEVTKAQWNKMGYNDSPEHTDIISTEDRTVTATLAGGKTKVIYADGKFVV